jgi:hypothetical protein
MNQLIVNRDIGIDSEEKYCHEYDLAGLMKCLIILLVMTRSPRVKTGNKSSSVPESGCRLEWHSSSPRA